MQALCRPFVCLTAAARRRRCGGNKTALAGELEEAYSKADKTLDEFIPADMQEREVMIRQLLPAHREEAALETLDAREAVLEAFSGLYDGRIEFNEVEELWDAVGKTDLGRDKEFWEKHGKELSDLFKDDELRKGTSQKQYRAAFLKFVVRSPRPEARSGPKLSHSARCLCRVSPREAAYAPRACLPQTQCARLQRPAPAASRHLRQRLHPIAPSVALGSRPVASRER